MSAPHVGPLALALMLAFGTMPGLAQTGPAEVPPDSFAGQQYVDSRGCLFVRAGSGGNTVWVPRVTRGGTPICDQPPSGQAAESAAPAAGQADPGTGAALVAPSGFMVAVGSFRDPGNADKAMARLAALSYPALRGRMPGASAELVTVLAGPFDSEEAARKALRELRGAGFPDAILIEP